MTSTTKELSSREGTVSKPGLLSEVVVVLYML